jgi:hypothetical protein
MKNLIRGIIKSDLDKAIKEKWNVMIAYHRAVAEMQRAAKDLEILEIYIEEMRELLMEENERPTP